MFVWQAVVRYAEKAQDDNLHAGLFTRFADGALFERLQEIELAAENAPAIGFRGELAQRQEHTAEFIDEKHTDSDSWKLDARTLDCGIHRSPLPTHFASVGMEAVARRASRAWEFSSTITMSWWARHFRC